MLKRVRELNKKGELKNVSRETVLAAQIFVADSLLTRTKGLLGETSLPTQSALWIFDCNSVHTFFMKFPIDIIFVNSDLQIRKIYRNVGPWRMTLPNFSFDSVFELPGGSLTEGSAQVGDQLHVGH